MEGEGTPVASNTRGRIYQQKTLIRDPGGIPDAKGRFPALLDAQGRKQYLLRSKFWWIRYRDANGNEQNESSGSTRKADALDLLSKRVGAVANGESVAPYRERLTFTDAMQTVVDDQHLRDRRSVADTERRIRLHLTPYFGGRLLLNIDSSTITAYCVHRKAEEAGPATINRELAILKRAFRLAVRSRKLASTPHIEMLEEPEARQGFFEQAEYAAVRAELPAHLRPLLTFYYWTGWRKQEALSLEVRQVDLAAGLITLDPEQSKNKRRRVLDFSGMDDLRDTLADQLAAAERIGRTVGRVVTAVFHEPDGTPVTAYRLRVAWEAARETAGYSHKQIHDFRRTRARNLVRAGVPESVAMKVTGHKTRSTFARYDITSGEDLREAGARVQAYEAALRAGKQQSGGNVTRFKRRAKG